MFDLLGWPQITKAAHGGGDVRVPGTHGIERAGVSWIEHLVTSDLGWLFRPQDIADFGIDAQLEVVDGDPAEATGRLLGVQIKSGASHFRVPSVDGWWFLCDAGHVSYWLGHSLPVLVMLYEPVDKRVYWQHVSDRTVVSTGKGAKIHVPKAQDLTSASAHLLRPLARSQADVPEVGQWITADIDRRQREEFHEFLLSARLLQMFPGCAVSRREWDRDGITLHVSLWGHSKRLPRIVVEVVIVASIREGVLLIARNEAGPRYVPIVIVVVDDRESSLPPTPTASHVLVTPWSADGRHDASLKRAMEDASRWVTEGGPLEGS
ncbi:DUF4365 domain-containing protein [Streptomyces sp. NPDC056527]|uniref:DUF4365 domain-containing protein n=1 Tax=Streptomyces sp. NPDC056527 TaxID=3345853 RepID=UPI0036C578AA